MSLASPNMCGFLLGKIIVRQVQINYTIGCSISMPILRSRVKGTGCNALGVRDVDDLQRQGRDARFQSRLAITVFHEIEPFRRQACGGRQDGPQQGPGHQAVVPVFFEYIAVCFEGQGPVPIECLYKCNQSIRIFGT